MSNLRAFLSVSVLLFAGCRQQKTGPDANYEKGSRIYEQLYAQELDDAYGDPKMEEAAALLKQVDPRSIDSDSAKRMLASIESGRANLEKERKDREKMAAAAAATVASQPRYDPQKIIADATPDAGPADPFGPGAAIADINATTGGCLIDGEPYREQGTGATGTVYRLAKSQQCAERLPGFVGQVVLAADGRIYRRTADPTDAKAPTATVTPDAATAAADAGVATRPAKVATRPPAVAPQPAQGPSDGGDAVMYIPGLPIPGGVEPSPPPDPTRE